MDAEKPPYIAGKTAEVRRAEKQVQTRFSEAKKEPTSKPTPKVFRAEHLGIIDIILLPGEWTEKSRNKRNGNSVATAFEQGDRMVSYQSSATPHPEILETLKTAPHKLSTSEVDKICASVKKPEIISASTIDVQGHKAMRIESRSSTGALEISLFVPVGSKLVEQLTFESKKQDPTLMSDFNAAVKTIVWKSDKEPPKYK